MSCAFIHSALIYTSKYLYTSHNKPFDGGKTTISFQVIYWGICRTCFLSQICQTSVVRIIFLYMLYSYCIIVIILQSKKGSCISFSSAHTHTHSHKQSVRREFNISIKHRECQHCMTLESSMMSKTVSAPRAFVCKCVRMRGGERGRRRGSTAVNQAERQAKRYATQWVHQYHVSVTPWHHIDCLSVPIWVRVQCASVRKW